MKFTGTIIPEGGITEEFRIAGCEGKQAFADRNKAAAVIRHRERRGTKGRRGQLHAYHCPSCRRWHLGNK